MNLESEVWSFIEKLNNQQDLSEIIINNPDDIYVEKKGQLTLLDKHFSKIELEKFINEVKHFNNLSFDKLNPILDGSLPDGSRINIIDGSFTKNGPAITIRKHNKNIKLFENESKLWGLSPKFKDFLKVLVHGKLNILISGATGSGKTTFLSLMLGEVVPSERIITIEDTYELQNNSKNVLSLINKQNIDACNLSVRDLVRNSLRMRPDRIIIGEVRGIEAFDFIQALNTGHEGSMSTIHSNGAIESLRRLENLMLLSQIGEVPLKALRYQITKAIDFVIHLKKDRSGERRISEITEVTGMETDRILTQEIAKTRDDKLVFTGLVPAKMDRLIPFGLAADFFL